MSDAAPQAAVEEKDIVLYETTGDDGQIALVTMNRPQYNNAQNGAMTYALDAAFRRAVTDDAVKVIVLRGAGKHFSAGHDIGTPGRDVHLSQDRVSLWYDHANKPPGEFLYVREQEAYLGMCRRWRDIPKPTIAQVQGACVAGGLMLAWVCDLIIASDDSFYADPVVRMGIPGVEYFAHPFELSPRLAKEFLFLGERWPAQRMLEAGMLNRVVPRDALELEALSVAERIAKMPRLGLALTKQAINHVEDLQGKRTGMDAVFAWHHFAHTFNDLNSDDPLAGFDAKSMAKSQREQPAKAPKS